MGSARTINFYFHKIEEKRD